MGKSRRKNPASGAASQQSLMAPPHAGKGQSQPDAIVQGQPLLEDELDVILDRITDKAGANTSIMKNQTVRRRLPPLRTREATASEECSRR
jgi:hypothetical protein